MKTMKNLLTGAALMLGLAAPALAETELVILGTGTPVADGSRAGAGAAVIYDGRAYLFDIGGGVVQNMIKASGATGVTAPKDPKGREALFPTLVDHLFLTHMHSDHIMDFPELAGTLWWRREQQMSVYGPTGTQAMADGYYQMLDVDTRLRIDGNQPVDKPENFKVAVSEHDGPFTVTDGDVTIEAFSVPHGDISPAFGYRITTPDKVIVISGDTNESDEVIGMAKGADILVHEVISTEGLNALPEFWQAYHNHAHTTTTELARIATEAQPGLLVLTHILHYGAPIETALTEIQAQYDGQVVLADDLAGF